MHAAADCVIFVGLDNPLGRRNQCTQRKGTRHHALIEGNQYRIHTLGNRNVDPPQ